MKKRNTNVQSKNRQHLELQDLPVLRRMKNFISQFHLQRFIKNSKISLFELLQPLHIVLNEH